MYEFRDAVGADFEFLYELLYSTMEDYYVQTFGAWDEAVERGFLADSLEQYRYQVIAVSSIPIGCWARQYSNESIFLAEMQILPEHQRKGHGRRLLQLLLAEALRLDVNVHLEVLTANHGARALYERLGFVVTDSTDTHYQMCWWPDQGPAARSS